MPPNPSIQSGRAGSMVLLVAPQRPAADFRRLGLNSIEGAQAWRSLESLTYN